MIDPTTHAITEFPIPNTDPDDFGSPGAFAIVAGSDGSIWFTLSQSDEIGVIDLNPSNTGSAGSPGGTVPAPLPAANSAGSPDGTVLASPPAVNAPPASGLQSGSTIGLTNGSSSAAVQDDETISLTLGNNSGGDSISVATMKGLTAVSGLTRRRFDHGAGYRFVAGKRAQVAAPQASRKGALPHLLATEKIFTAGKGTTKQIVGFRVVLARTFEPAIAGDMTDRIAAIPGGEPSGTVGLQVSYKTSSGIDSLVLFGEAKVASTGHVVVVAKC